MSPDQPMADAMREVLEPLAKKAAKRVRKAREPDFTKDTRKHGVEVYLDENNGNLIFITEMGNLWVAKATVDAAIRGKERLYPPLPPVRH